MKVKAAGSGRGIRQTMMVLLACGALMCGCESEDTDSDITAISITME